MKHLKKQFIIASIFFCLILWGQTLSANDQKIIPIKSNYYTVLEQLASTQGLSVSKTRPFSSDEFIMLLDKINPLLLDRISAIRYKTLIDDLAQYSELSQKEIKGDFSVTLAFESYLHTEGDHFIHESDWVYDNEMRKPMVALEFDSHVAKSIYLYTNFIVKNNRFSRPEETSPPSPRIPVDTLMFSPSFSTNIVKMANQDFDVPSRAFIAVGGEGYSIQLGRDKLSWGPGDSGNFIIGNHHKYQEFLRFTFYNEDVKFTNAILFMQPPGYTTKERSPYVPASPADYTVKMFLAHRLEFNVNSWLNIELSENVIYQDTTFNAKYLNPLYIYHNFSNRSLFNAIADISIEATISKGLRVYTSIAFDQLTAPGESSDQPAALGYMVGAKYYYPVARGWWDFLLEGVYIDPYMYLRDSVDFIVMTREREQYYGYVPHYEYLGYKDGGDLILATVKGKYHLNEAFSIASSFTYKAQGSMGFDTEYVVGAMDNINSPSSPVTHWFISTLSTQYSKNVSLLFFDSLSLYGEVNVVNKKESSNPTHTDFQFTFSVQLGL